MNQKRAKFGTLVLLLTILSIILFFGLRPKTRSITNNTQWLPTQQALQFDGHSIAYIDNLYAYDNSDFEGEFTIHIYVIQAPASKQGFRPVLMIHSGDDNQQLSVWNWGSSLIVMNGADYDYHRKKPRISAKNVFTSTSAKLISITSGTHGTRLFINGKIVKKIKNWRLTIPDNKNKRRLILGNSIHGKHGWKGVIAGLSLYGKALSTEEISTHYKQWIANKDFSQHAPKDALLIFTFKENKGNSIPDESGHNQPLLLPSQLIPLQKTFLSAPWQNVQINRFFWFDTILNFLGFIPLGAVAYSFLKQQVSSAKYPIMIVTLFCFLLSLGLEISQGWLPNRTSSLSDLTLNTLGAWLGAILTKAILQERKIESK